jgi:N6-L-threonylcarbamoyladenine synthase
MDTHLSRNPDLKTGLDSLIEEMGIKDIDAIAVTSGPGLEPALWVGIAGALALGAAWDIPVYPVDHMEGHFLSVVGSHGSSIEYPALALLISGGHTEFIAARTPFAYEKIGRTRDDAVGEAFDKVARLLNLPYPGGPELSALAEKARESAIFSEITLPRPMLNSGDLDFSFSGLKTAVRYAIAGKELNDAERMGIAREFEDAVRDVLKKKAADAIHVFKPVTFIVAGGVSQNGGIRADLEEIMDGAGIHFLAPQAGLAGDNAIMIALASYSHVLQGKPPRTITAAGAQELGVHKNPA